MKNFVTVERHICLVCGKEYDTGSILMDTRLKERFERQTVTGYSLCPEDTKKRDEGYIALIEARPQEDGSFSSYRTGVIVHIREEVWGTLFKSPVPKEKIAYIAPEITKELRKFVAKEENETKIH